MSPGAIEAPAGQPAPSRGGVPFEPGPRSRTWRGEASRGRVSVRTHLAAVGEDLARLVGLQWELGKAEGRQIVRALVAAAGLVVAGLVVAVAALVVLAAGVVAYALEVPWSHLVGAGGMALVLGLIATGWGVYRFRRLPWPVESRRSIEETLRWLEAQLRSRLRFG
jgi:hypothetical protein